MTEKQIFPEKKQQKAENVFSYFLKLKSNTLRDVINDKHTMGKKCTKVKSNLYFSLIFKLVPNSS